MLRGTRTPAQFRLAFCSKQRHEAREDATRDPATTALAGASAGVAVHESCIAHQQTGRCHAP
jgi:hypothetical protein